MLLFQRLRSTGANEFDQGRHDAQSVGVSLQYSYTSLLGQPIVPSPRAIAASLKRSALQSRRRKAEPFRSAMSMLNFHINRSGRGLTAERRAVLERAKVELRRLFGRQS